MDTATKTDGLNIPFLVSANTMEGRLQLSYDAVLQALAPVGGSGAGIHPARRAVRAAR